MNTTTIDKYSKLTEEELFIIKEYLKDDPDPVEWIEENIIFPSRGFMNFYPAVDQKIKLRNYQKFPIRYALGFTNDGFKPHQINIKSSVRFSKTLIAVFIMLYYMRFKTSNIISCFANESKVMDFFSNKITPLIKINEEFKRLWSGKLDDLNSREITLLNGILRVASAEGENSLASDSCQLMHMSEVAKYHKRFDVITMGKNRTQDYHASGEYLVICESSPKSKSDPFSIECSTTPQLYPYVKLSCGHYHYLEDSIIKLSKEFNPNELFIANKLDIIKENPNNAYIECPTCLSHSYQKDMNKILDSVIWCENNKQIKNDTQPDFNYDRVTFNGNRLYSYSYKLVDCMVDYFTALFKTDGRNAFNLYQTETMGREAYEQININDNGFKVEEHKENYTIHAPVNIYPQEVDFAFVGSDVQDDCIYYFIGGFQKNTGNIYLLDEGQVNYNNKRDGRLVKLDESEYNNIYLNYYNSTFGKEFNRPDGSSIPIIGGLSDFGGHYHKLITYISSRISGLWLTHGITRDSKNLSDIVNYSQDSEIKKLTACKTKVLSKMALNYLYQLDGFNLILPNDVSFEFLSQINTEVWSEDKQEMITISKNNHLRSCFNYFLGGAYLWGAFETNYNKIDKALLNFKNNRIEEVKKEEVVKVDSIKSEIIEQNKKVISEKVKVNNVFNKLNRFSNKICR